MDFESIVNQISQHIKTSDPIELLIRLISSLITVLMIMVLFNLIQLIIGKIVKDKISEQRHFMIKKGIKYTGFVMALLFVLRTMGVDTTVLTGAAGIVGIVVGFAAQTTVSSFISGFFLLSEKHFRVGDSIKVDTILGVVVSVDLLAVKIRTFDNLYVRIPNETLIKSNLICLSRFAIRRLDLVVTVAYSEDLERVRELLLDIAQKDNFVLDNPPPLFRLDKLDHRGATIIFNVWFESQYVLETQTSMLMTIKKRFAEEHIELPYQRIALLTESIKPEV
ncbi:MAG: mechanosensitive ion channel family protein [Spirochaetaceae bacterium]|jgi:small-conductance mechanosensitive channel|nr:mechanosensitive ion channel family protein [Spirochaetaceae bacterium]